jgi:hypothetical protein
VGAHDACGAPIEVDMNNAGTASHHWVKLSDGEHRKVAVGAETMTEITVWVRSGEDELGNEFTVLREDLTQPPQGSDYDLEVVIEGELCPA